MMVVLLTSFETSSNAAPVGLRSAGTNVTHVIAGAVAATGETEQVIRRVIARLDPEALTEISGVTVIVPLDDGLVIETPRYARFTEILVEIARRGGAIREIAGNDEVMVSLTVPDGAPADLPHGTVLLRLKRDGMPGERLLVNVHVTELAALVRAHRQENPGLEHAFDY